MSHTFPEPLRKALEAMRHPVTDPASQQRALDRAKEIQSLTSRTADFAPRVEPSQAKGFWQRGLRGSQRAAKRWRVALPVAAAVILAVAVGVSGILFSGPAGLVFAEVRESMTRVTSVHLVILSENDGSGGPVEVWYKRGNGFAMQSPLGWEIDDGVTHWDYSRLQNVVVRSKSRMAHQSYPDVQRLGKAMGFYIDDVPESLSRLPDHDSTLHRTSQTDQHVAYVWDMEHHLSPEERIGQPDEIRAERRIVFWIDEAKRIRRCEHQRGLDGKWTTYRTVVVSYTREIDAGRFEPKWEDDVRVVDATAAAGEPASAILDPEVARIVAGIDKRHASYRGLRFQYEVATEFKVSPEAIFHDDRRITHGLLRTRDTFAILEPHQAAGRPWRFWQRKVLGPDGRWDVERFFAFNGNQTNCYRPVWPRMSAEEPPADRRRQWAGQIYPGEADDLRENLFDSFLFLRLNGIDDAQALPDELRYHHLDRFHVIGRRQTENGEVLTLGGSSSAEFGMDYRVETTGEPHFVLLRWEARYAKKADQLLTRYEVHEVRNFNGVSYPAKGSFRQFPMGNLHDIWYQFEVTSVEPVAGTARQTWMPAWPSSTATVTDQNGNAVRPGR